MQLKKWIDSCIYIEKGSKTQLSAMFVCMKCAFSHLPFYTVLVLPCSLALHWWVCLYMWEWVKLTGNLKLIVAKLSLCLFVVQVQHFKNAERLNKSMLVCRIHENLTEHVKEGQAGLNQLGNYVDVPSRWPLVYLVYDTSWITIIVTMTHDKVTFQ